LLYRRMSVVLLRYLSNAYLQVSKLASYRQAAHMQNVLSHTYILTFPPILCLISHSQCSSVAHQICSRWP